MGRGIDIGLLNSIAQMIQELGLYKSGFEPRLLESMSSFYDQEARRLISKLSVSDYITYTKHQYEYEESDQQAYLLSSTRHKLSKIVLDKWILDNLEVLVSKGNKSMCIWLYVYVAGVKFIANIPVIIWFIT